MRPRRIAVLALLAPMLALAAPEVATAAPPVTASGTVSSTSFAVTGSRTAGGVTFFTFAETDSLQGTFVGRTTLSGECIQRPTGPILCKASETFTGTILGRSGTVNFLNLISVDPSTGAVEGRFTSVGGSGELAGVHTVGTFEAQGGAGSYSGTVVFAP